MARHNDGEKVGLLGLHLEMGCCDPVLLALMRAGSEQHRAARQRRGEPPLAGKVGWWRRGVGLEISDIERARHPELSEALGETIVLRKHEVEGREQRPAHAGTPPP